MKKFALIALLLCLAVAGCEDKKGTGSTGGSPATAPAPTGSAS